MFALALWSYTSLNQTYSTYVSVPFEVILPNSKALESALPNEVTVELKGNGWQLFNIIYFNSSKICRVDLSRENITGNQFEIQRQQLLKSVTNVYNVETKDVLPERFTMNIGQIGEKYVSIVPEYEVSTDEDYVMIGEPIISPNKVKIRGNVKIIDKIDTWRTKKFTYINAHRTLKAKGKLSDSLESVIEFGNKEVTMLFDIQQEAVIEVFDVDIEVQNLDVEGEFEFYPNKVKVYVGIGVNSLELFDYDRVRAMIKINKQNMVHGVASVEVFSGSVGKIKKIVPEYVNIYQKSDKLSISR